MPSKKHIWLLSAYRADSHAAWADWLVENHPDIEWQRLELPGRHFRWRIRGNPLSWLDVLPQQTPDLILATSMVDLATLKGIHPRLASVPAYYYFHENQFAYPVSEHQARSIEPQMVQLYGALAADRLLFNSAFNRDSFLEGVEALLNKMPDEKPAGLRQRLKKKSSIYPVPINPVAADDEKDLKLILWNHRWEYDKAPELFVEAMMELAGWNLPGKAVNSSWHCLVQEPCRHLRRSVIVVKNWLTELLLMKKWIPTSIANGLARQVSW